MNKEEDVMSKKKHCKYCGGAVKKSTDMCADCRDKLRVIRQLRAIIFGIARGEEGDHINDQRRNDPEVQTVQRAAS